MEKELTVGDLRQQSALVDSDERVIILVKDRYDKLMRITLTQCYPDTTNENGDWFPTFKIIGEMEK